MRLHLLVRMLACVAIVLHLAYDARASEGLTIPSFAAEITVNPNGTLSVQEDFTTRALYASGFGDIGRDLPINAGDRWDTRFTDSGKTALLITDQRVYRDGSPIPAPFDARGGRADLLLGHIPTGEHHYRVSYVVSGAIRFAPGAGATDSLYWNALGHNWHYQVGEASITVHLPVSVSGSEISAEAYPCVRGRAENMRPESNAAEEIPGTKTFTQRNLGPRESLAVVVRWPTGIIKNHTYDAAKKLMFLPFALLVYYVIVWLTVARRPSAGTIVPLYTPPDNMSPAEIRLLRAGRSDQKSVAAVVAHLAARRLISVQPDGDEYLMTRLVDKLPRDLPEEERAAFVSMFLVTVDVTDPASSIGVYHTDGDMPLGRSFRLRVSQGNKIGAIRAAIASALDRRIGDSYRKRNFEYSAPAIALSSSLAIGTAATFTHAEGILFFTLWFVFAATILGIMISLNVLPALRDILKGRMNPSSLLLLAGPLVIFLALLAYMAHMIAHVSDPTFAMSLVAIVLLNASFPFLLQTPTELGRKRMDEVEGFRQFLASVELDSVDRLNNPHWTPTLKVDYLAYAIALDLKQAWGDHLVTAMFNTVTTSN